MKKQDNNFYTLNNLNLNNGFGLITSNKALSGAVKKPKVLISHLLCEESFDSFHRLLSKIDYHYTNERLDVGVCAPDKASFSADYLSKNSRKIRYYKDAKLTALTEVETLNDMGLVIKKVTYVNTVATEQIEYEYTLKEYGGLQLPLLIKEVYTDLISKAKISAKYNYKGSRLISITGSEYSCKFTYKSKNERIKTTYKNDTLQPGTVIQLLDDYGNVIKNKYFNDLNQLVQTINFKYLIK